MPDFRDGSHVPALVTARPVRGLFAVKLEDDVPWPEQFIAALRNQCLTWGGQANLPVPWSSNIEDNPLFWRIVEAQDPDIVIGHPGSWADLEDLVPDRYETALQAQRRTLKRHGFQESIIERTIEEWTGSPLVDKTHDLGERVTRQLIARGGCLRWRDH